MQDDEQVFAFIDASIRRECAQKASQEQPWAGGVPGVGLVKRNDFNFLAGAQNRETHPSLSRDNGGHSEGSLPSAMDPKTVNGSDAQVTPQLMSPDADDLADSAWLNESANLDEIDIEELANGTTVLELVDLPEGENATQDNSGVEAGAQHVPSRPDTSENVRPIDASLPPQETGAPEQPASADPELAQLAKLTPEEELLDQLQHQAIQPTKEEEFQQRMDALRSDQPVYNTTAPIQSVDERFEQVQRLMQGGSTPAQAGPSTSAGPPPAAEASTSTGLGAELGAQQAQTLAGESNGSHEDQVKELLAQLKDSLANAPTAAPTGEAAAEEDCSEVASDDGQVQSLVERAALGDFDEVPDVTEESAPAGDTPSSPDSLDKQLKQQWRRHWQEQEDRQRNAHLSSELSCELDKVDDVATSVAAPPRPSQSPLVAAMPASGADVEWSAQEAQRPDVKEAKELLDKLQHCNRQPTGHERAPLWRAAIALRAAAQGVDALQGGRLKVAAFLNYIVDDASNGASLQPGDMLQVENFLLKYHKTTALLKAQTIAQQATTPPAHVPSAVVDPSVEMPDVPTHKPEQ